jgi:hypothetical protein
LSAMDFQLTERSFHRLFPKSIDWLTSIRKFSHLGVALWSACS